MGRWETEMTLYIWFKELKNAWYCITHLFKYRYEPITWANTKPELLRAKWWVGQAYKMWRCRLTGCNFVVVSQTTDGILTGKCTKCGTRSDGFWDKQLFPYSRFKNRWGI